MWTSVQINFSIVDGRGWCGGACDGATLDTTRDAKEQAAAHVAAWLERHNRIFGANIIQANVLSAYYSHRGFWHTMDEKHGWRWSVD